MIEGEGEEVVVIDWLSVTNLTHTFSWAELYAAASMLCPDIHPVMSRRELATRLATFGIDVSNVRYALAHKEDYS